jgi:ABC-type polysaccharide/polyol phosphate export permease
VAALPPGLQIVARLLPLTYAVEALRVALFGGPPVLAALDLLALTGFAVGLFVLAVKVLAQRVS